jgi:hypothetical protein
LFISGSVESQAGKAKLLTVLEGGNQEDFPDAMRTTLSWLIAEVLAGFIFVYLRLC